MPEFLRLRYNRKAQLLNAVLMSVMMACIAGISLYAISTMLGDISALGILADGDPRRMHRALCTLA